MNDLRLAFAPLVIALAGTAITQAETQKPLVEIPFQRDGLLLLVEARINNSEPAVFLVDTGAPHSILDPKLARELSLSVKSSTAVTGTGKGQVSKSTTAPQTISLSGFNIELPEPWVIDLSNVPIPARVRGLVGAELFEKFVVRMDPLQARFSVFDPDLFRYTGAGTAIPLLLENGRLFLEAELEVPAGKTVTHKLRIDTGSESSVNDEVVRQSEELRRSTLGGGLGENFKSYSGVFTSVKIGPFAIKHVWGPGGAPPSVGMEILRRFIVTFDAPHGRIYLEPTAALAEPVPTPPSQ